MTEPFELALEIPLARYKGILATIASQEPNISLLDALRTAASVEKMFETELRMLDSLPPEGSAPPLPGASTEVLGRWAATQPDLMKLLPTNKLQAIKELRAVSRFGLKEAKEALEWVLEHMPWACTGTPPPW